MRRRGPGSPPPTGVRGPHDLLAGEVAGALGIGVQTLHYYERERLLPPVPRSAAGYRLYPPDMVTRVHFIRKAQALGLSLGDIRDVLELAEQGTSPCGRVQAALADRLAEVDALLGALREFRDELAMLVAEAPAKAELRAAATQVCAIVEGATVPAASVPVGAPLGRRRRGGA